MFLNAEEKFDRQTLTSNKNLIPLFLYEIVLSKR